jgi:hypothetical protein
MHAQCEAELDAPATVRRFNATLSSDDYVFLAQIAA